MLTIAKFKFESLEKERDSVLKEKRRLSSSLGEEVSKTVEEEEVGFQYHVMIRGLIEIV